jgi:hypothetical protein
LLNFKTDINSQVFIKPSLKNSIVFYKRVKAIKKRIKKKLIKKFYKN